MRSGSWGSVSVDWADQSGVYGQLGAVEEWEPVHNDLQPPAIQHTNDTQVQVTDKDVRPDPRTRFSANAGGRCLQGEPPATQDACH